MSIWFGIDKDKTAKHMATELVEIKREKKIWKYVKSEYGRGPKCMKEIMKRRREM